MAAASGLLLLPVKSFMAREPRYGMMTMCEDAAPLAMRGL
jgi:hypothetical protein